MTARDILDWRDRYDRAAVLPWRLDGGGIDWRACCSSMAARAIATAHAVFSGPVVQLHELCEPQVLEFQTGGLKMPVLLCQLLLRAAWMTSHASQRSAKADFDARLNRVSQMLAATTVDTLIVSHAGIMAYLRRELLRQGFKGPRFGVPGNGRLYVFERWIG